MGMTKKYSYLHGGVVYEKGFSTYNEDELRYDSSFDWIVPVAQEIIYKYQTVSELFDKAYKENPYDLKHIYK
jgi:hypothetical protein